MRFLPIASILGRCSSGSATATAALPPGRRPHLGCRTPTSGFSGGLPGGNAVPEERSRDMIRFKCSSTPLPPDIGDFSLHRPVCEDLNRRSASTTGRQPRILHFSNHADLMSLACRLIVQKANVRAHLRRRIPFARAQSSGAARCSAASLVFGRTALAV